MPSGASAKEGSWMRYVYLLESEKHEGLRYVGVTSDLKQRIADHNAGKSPHTSKDMPWKLDLCRVLGRAEGRSLRALLEIRFGARVCHEAALV